MIDVSIIIINYNASKLLEDCIDSLRLHCSTVSYEIIVVDNNSTDGDIKRNFQNNSKIKLIINSEKEFGNGGIDKVQRLSTL